LAGYTLKTVSSLQGRWNEATGKAFAEIDENYDFLLKELDNLKQEDEFLQGIRASLKTTHDELVRKLADEEFKAKLKGLDERFYYKVEDASRKISQNHSNELKNYKISNLRTKNSSTPPKIQSSHSNLPNEDIG